MKISPIYFVNGKHLPKNKAFIGVLDIGLLRAYGVFDFLVTYKGNPFLLDEHTNRLFNSASAIGLDIGKTEKQIKSIVLNTLNKNRWRGEKTVRIVVTGGVGENTITPSSQSTIIVIIDHKHNYPRHLYENGIKTITFNHVRSQALVKSLEYSDAIKALQIARRKGALEVIYIDKSTDRVSEATTSNLFIVKKGKIFTPKDNVLNGITRDTVIMLLKQTNPVVQKIINRKELFSADEVFITASNKEVMPVVAIDDQMIGNGKVGDITKEVMDTFKVFIQKGKW